MARNIARYGYGPNRSSDILRVAWDGLYRGTLPAGRPVRPKRTVEQQRAAIEPMKHGERIWAYMRQNRSGRTGPVKSTLTPRQMRRLRHKSKLGGAQWEAGIRPA